ncbi:hypothetical protein V2J09_022497 [Rumex salicifolius]
MKRRDDKGKEEEEEKEVLCRLVRCKGEKLVLLAPPKRRGSTQTATSTPVLPWIPQDGGGLVGVGGADFNGGGALQQHQQQGKVFSSLFLPPSPPPIPARKLAAAVWKFIQYFSPPGAMEFGGDSDDFRVRQNQRRRRDHYLHHRHQQGFDDQVNFGGPSHRTPEHQPPTASNLRRQVAMLLAQHNRSREHNHPPPQPPSPASYGSSIEINAYNNQASTPTSSIELKGKMGDSSFGFKTSTELLKVLNRIWTLEEQHISNITLVKDLKTELDRARTKILELLRDQHSSRNEINELMKQVTEDKAGRKSKEQERIHATIKSLKDELEDERKLRKRSEGLHRRLAREMFEVKLALSTSLKELERERSGRCLLEDLCDEFAKGILEYEQDAHALRQRNEKNGIGGDSLVVQMSESWLDERIQMRDHQEEQEMVVYKIRDEIENFLQARKMVASREDAKQSRLRRKSVESFHLNELASAPLNGFDSHEDKTKAVVDQEKVNNTEISAFQPPDKGKGAIDKPVSELLLSEGNRAMADSGSKNSLKAKLQEPKTRVGYRSRLRILKGSS